MPGNLLEALQIVKRYSGRIEFFDGLTPPYMTCQVTLAEPDPTLWNSYKFYIGFSSEVDLEVAFINSVQNALAQKG